ncbi:hypothetical protein L0F63_006604, partial [Massospora cicadina]
LLIDVDKFLLPLLGPNLKYSCNLFLGDESLEQAEINMLELYCERAQLRDSMRILDAGCGVGLVFEGLTWFNFLRDTPTPKSLL